MILIDRDKLLNHLGAIFVKYPEYRDAYQLARSAIRNEKLEVKAIPVKWIEYYYKYRLMPRPVEWFTDADKLRHELIMGRDLVGAKYTDMADTVEAIPIEWIEEYVKKTSKKCCHCSTAIWEMLEDWEKEK